MRSEGAEGSSSTSDCDDPLVVIACAAETDACPAACREDAKEPEIVKAGDLQVTASAAAGKSVIINGTNDLDTLTFKTSEEVELTKVVLERYGYSTSDEVVEVWLEDEDGNKIADERSLNNKDQVTLSIKKDYRSIDGTLNATVVAKVRSLPSASTDPFYDSTLTDASLKNGSSLGFKVVDVTSTAKNVDLGGYGANLYDIVSYKAGQLTLNVTAAAKSYNYEAGESYELAKFKTTNNGTNAISVNGFTLHNYGTLAAEDFVEDVVVTANGEEVKGLKASFNKDDELVISFNSVEVASKKKVTWVVSASLKDDFDEYGKFIAFALQDTDDLNATENKTDARVSISSNAGIIYNLKYDDTDKRYEYATTDVAPTLAWAWPVYAFAGGKIKLTNTKLGNIDAAAGSTDVVIAEGTLSISEPVKGTFTLDAKKAGVDALTMVIDGEEYDSKKSSNTFTFSNIEIEKGGKIQFKVDLDSDDDLKGTVIDFGTFKFAGLTYVESKNPVNSKDIAGSITFSKLTIQAAKASLENNANDTIEFVVNDGARKVVFDGTYTAKKADVYLNEIEVTGTMPTNTTSMTFYLFVDGDEIANVDLGESQTFSNLLVKAGEKVNIKVEADVEATDKSAAEGNTFTVILKGEDADGLQIKDASADTVTVKVVNKGTVTVDTAASKNTVLLKKANVSVAKFTIKPDNSNDKDLYLEDLTISVTNNGSTPLSSDKVRVKIAGTEEDGNDYPAFDEAKAYAKDDIVIYTDGFAYQAKGAVTAKAFDNSEWTKLTNIYYDLNEEIGDGVEVEVVLKNKADAAGVVTVTVDSVNGNGVGTKVFKKRFEPVLVSLHTEDMKGSTKVILGVEKANSSDVVSDVAITIEGTATPKVLTTSEVVDGDDFEVSPSSDKSTHMITAVSYCVNKVGCTETDTANYVLIEKEGANGYNDYFRDGSTYAKIFNVD